MKHDVCGADLVTLVVYLLNNIYPEERTKADIPPLKTPLATELLSTRAHSLFCLSSIPTTEDSEHTYIPIHINRRYLLT